ncbi:polysaccharide deacetylase family protein [Alkalihalobacillus pseudalcaliphilus]|uniref:polysaccharide deacetylase family protein n=1 Tax=Alkalihalobacillus pseudalcaliphilus TaxID=79884 RepID=UPI00069F042F|nr:polysaccharide deacetylase family protein [Alkalihalobacillus pseudalcaliphilus]
MSLKMKSYVLLSLFGILTLLIAIHQFSPSIGVATNSVQTDINYESRYAGLDIEFVSKHSEDYTTSISKPVTSSQKVNEKIEAWLTEQEEQFLEDVHKLKSSGTLDVQANLNIQLETNPLAEQQYHLLFHVYQFMGGANGQESLHSLTVDVASGKLITIEQILDTNHVQFTDIHTLLVNALIEEGIDDIYQEELSTTMNNPSLWTWTTNEEGLTLHFDEYEIAAGSNGPIHVTLPFDEISDYIKDDWKRVWELVEETPTESEEQAEDEHHSTDVHEPDQIIKEKEEQDPPQEDILFEPNQLEKDGKYIALTFDDGPHPRITPQILETLESFDARATFYMLGTQVDFYPELAIEVALSGHEIGNHTMNHMNMTTLNREQLVRELADTTSMIEEVIGITPTTMRPPYGIYNQQVVDVSTELNLAIVNWSVDSEDWRSREVGAIKEMVFKDAANGRIVLFHDIHQATADALPAVMEQLQAEGYQFVTVSELLELEQSNLDIGPHSRRVIE